MDLHQGNVAELLVENDEVRGVRTALGLELSHPGPSSSAPGPSCAGSCMLACRIRAVDGWGTRTSTISQSLADLGFEVERFKTGTPCRINGRSVDFSKCEAQGGDDPPPLFSFMGGHHRGRG